jgi:hypothetical protein
MKEDEMELRELLGQARFHDFAKEYLIFHGESPDEADLIIHLTEAKEAAREDERREKQSLQKKKDAFLREHILSYRFITGFQPPYSDQNRAMCYPVYYSEIQRRTGRRRNLKDDPA